MHEPSPPGTITGSPPCWALTPATTGFPTSPPGGQEAIDELLRSVLTALPTAEVAGDEDRRCARLLRERLEAQLAVSDSGEHLRAVSNIIGPHVEVRELFDLSRFHTFVTQAPEETDPSVSSALEKAAGAAAAAAADLRDHLTRVYLPAAQGTPDAVGPERYRLGARLSKGSDLDLAEAYEWGWNRMGLERVPPPRRRDPPRGREGAARGHGDRRNASS